LLVIEQGLRDEVPQKPEREPYDRPDEETVNRYEALRRWRKRRAESRGVESDVILSNRTLHLLASHNPTSPKALDAAGLLNDWERRAYGREIVALLRRQRRIAST
jgi:ribonuclease D